MATAARRKPRPAPSPLPPAAQEQDDGPVPIKAPPALTASLGIAAEVHLVQFRAGWLVFKGFDLDELTEGERAGLVSLTEYVQPKVNEDGEQILFHEATVPLASIGLPTKGWCVMRPRPTAERAVACLFLDANEVPLIGGGAS